MYKILVIIYNAICQYSQPAAAAKQTILGIDSYNLSWTDILILSVLTYP